VSDIDTGVVDSLKALDPEWPIREADIGKPEEADRCAMALNPVATDATGSARSASTIGGTRPVQSWSGGSGRSG
jgi:hypothetical protein